MLRVGLITIINYNEVTVLLNACRNVQSSLREKKYVETESETPDSIQHLLYNSHK